SLKTLVPRPLMVVLPVPSAQMTMRFMCDPLTVGTFGRPSARRRHPPVGSRSPSRGRSAFLQDVSHGEQLGSDGRRRGVGRVEQGRLVGSFVATSPLRLARIPRSSAFWIGGSL